MISRVRYITIPDGSKNVRIGILSIQNLLEQRLDHSGIDAIIKLLSEAHSLRRFYSFLGSSVMHPMTLGDVIRIHKWDWDLFVEVPGRRELQIITPHQMNCRFGIL